MIDLKKWLLDHSVELTDMAPGSHKIDCPKDFCKDNRDPGDTTPLTVKIVGDEFVELKCSNCLWSDHAGERPAPAKKIAAAVPAAPIVESHSYDPTLPIILVEREADRKLLLDAGFKGVITIPLEEDDGFRDPREDHDPLAKLDVPALAESGCRIVIAVDNENEKLRTEVARRFGAARCACVTYSHGTAKKTVEKIGIDELCNDINLAQPYPISGLYTVTDFEQSLVDYFEGGMKRGLSTGWLNVDRLYTIMPGELTVVTGVPNNGKSEWIDALAVNLAQAEGYRFGVFSPENAKEQHVTKLIEKRVEMSASPRAKERMSMETFIEGAAWAAQHFIFVVGDDGKDLPTLDWLIEKFTAAILRFGIRGAIIDPWNEIEHSRPTTMSETEYVSLALSKLKRFARNHGLHIWLVAHPNKMQTGKDGKIAVPSLYDISGSAHWANKADNGIVIHRAETIDDGTEIHVKKVRFKHVGRRGNTTLKYNKITGRYGTPDENEAKYSAQENEEGDDEIQDYQGAAS